MFTPWLTGGIQSGFLEREATLRTEARACTGRKSFRRGAAFGFGAPLVFAAAFLAGHFLSSSQAQAQSLQPHADFQAAPAPLRAETIQDYNQRLEEMLRAADDPAGSLTDQDYRIGPDDLLDVSVFEVPDLNRTVRVSAEGEILLPLLGTVRAAGLTPSGLAHVLEDLLRKSYMKDPHVGVFVREMQSHPVSVFGAIAKPGVYQIGGAKSLIEVLSMAQGLATDAGDKVIIERHGSEGARPATGAEDGSQTAVPQDAADQASLHAKIQDASGPLGDRAVEVRLKELMDSGNPRHNVLVYPGDIVKVVRADVIYVVGEVRKPGGFPLSTNENISVLQALALAEGLTRTSAAQRSRVIRTDRATGNRTEIPIDIRRILSGKTPDPMLQARDIIFIPNSSGKAALYRGAEAAIGVGSGLLIYKVP